MAEEREREHKRVRQACANCRRKKTRCSGDRPICAFCARLGQPCVYTEDFYPGITGQHDTDQLPLENHRLAARVALLESRLSLLDANHTVPTAPSASGTSPEQRFNATDAEREALHSGTRPESEYASLLNHSVLQSLTDVYFRYCHQQPYTYFHESSFRQNLEDGTLPSYLIFAFAATAVRYSHEPCFAGRLVEAMDCYSKLAWSEIMEQSFSDTNGPSISTVQAANMLGIIDYVAGRHQIAWVKIGLAVRLAQTLQLGKEPQSWLSSHAVEERRHTFWSVYLLDRLVACGRDRPPMLLDVDCKVRLPVNPCSFQTALEAQPPTLAAIQEIPDTPPFEKSDHFALTIFMVSTLGYVARWAFKQGTPESRLPWDSRSEFARINGILLSFESYSDACDGNFVDILDRHFVFQGVVDEGMSAHFTYSHVIYHVNQCLLHHPFLLRQHLRIFKANVPVGFLRGAMLKSIEHATRLAGILGALQERGCEVYPSFYGYAAIVAGTILRLHSERASPLEKDHATSHYNSCLGFLEYKSVRWQSYACISKILRAFEPTPSLAANLLSLTLDRTPLEPELEEALWQMCDYSWLVSSSRLTTNTTQTPPLKSALANEERYSNPRTGDTPDFDTLLAGALSLDYSLFGNTGNEDGSGLSLQY